VEAARAEIASLQFFVTPWAAAGALRPLAAIIADFHFIWRGDF
jgi:hypothetical protein